MRKYKDRSEYYRKWYEDRGKDWSAQYYREKHPNAAPYRTREKARGIRCSVDGCNSDRKSTGFCSKHYARYRNWGDPLFSKYPNRGHGNITEDGYKRICVDGVNVLEHRFIMEKILGRNLTRDETVHHKDGNRLNNSLENLEILPNGIHVTLHLKRRVPENTEANKRCPKCGLVLLRSEFHKGSSNSDGLRSWCKQCTLTDNKARKERVSI